MQSPLDAAVMSIADLLAALREPVRKTFEGLVFTVAGDVERVSPFQRHLYVTMVDRSGGQQYTLKAFVRDAVIAACKCEIAPKMKLLVSGTITLSKNEIQLNATALEDLGYGRMQKQLEDWKVQYAELFARPKKPIPEICRAIVVISNQSIQGCQDFNKHLRYGSARILDTKMQGEAVAASIASAIRTVNERGGCDLIVIARGGGSPAELFDFSRPELLEAIAASTIPVATAIGHETDYPLCDLAADRRFSTPTDAGRQLSEQVERAMKELRHARQRISAATVSRIDLALMKLRKQLDIVRLATGARVDAAIQQARTAQAVMDQSALSAIETAIVRLQSQRKQVDNALDAARKRHAQRLHHRKMMMAAAAVIVILIAVILGLVLRK